MGPFLGLQQSLGKAIAEIVDLLVHPRALNTSCFCEEFPPSVRSRICPVLQTGLVVRGRLLFALSTQSDVVEAIWNVQPDVDIQIKHIAVQTDVLYFKLLEILQVLHEEVVEYHVIQQVVVSGEQGIVFG